MHVHAEIVARHAQVCEATLPAPAASVWVELFDSRAQREQIRDPGADAATIGAYKLAQRSTRSRQDGRAAGERLENVYRTGVLPLHRHPEAARAGEQLAFACAPYLADELDPAREARPPSTRDDQLEWDAFGRSDSDPPAFDGMQTSQEEIEVSLSRSELVLIKAHPVEHIGRGSVSPRVVFTHTDGVRRRGTSRPHVAMQCFHIWHERRIQDRRVVMHDINWVAYVAARIEARCAHRLSVDFDDAHAGDLAAAPRQQGDVMTHLHER